MKKKIIALSVAFVLVAIAAIGATVAYLTDTGSVVNNFAVGDVAFEAYEEVNHVNNLGTEKDTVSGVEKINISEGLDNTNGANYTNIMPGDVMTKTVKVTNAVAASEDVEANPSNPAYFKVLVDVTNGDVLDDLDAELGNDTFTGAGWTEKTPDFTKPYTATEHIGTVKTVNGNDTQYEIYYYVPAGETFNVDLGVTCPGGVDNTALAEYDDLKIAVKIGAIQAEGFSTAEAAYTALVEAYSALA